MTGRPNFDIELTITDWEFKRPFRIAYRTRTHARTVVVTLRDGTFTGRGEALGVSYHGETADTIAGQIETVADTVRAGISREALATLLSPGGARNALDCALWDIEARRKGRRAWELAGVAPVRPVRTTLTLAIDEPGALAEQAMANAGLPLFKIKLNGDGADLARVKAVRAARPDATLLVDANQGWDAGQLETLAHAFVPLGVRLIEQPLPAGEDAILDKFKSPIPLCADESCQTLESLGALAGRYDYVNIKLDKTGGLTEALALASAAKDAGFKILVGCMGGTSLSMAPGFVVGQCADLCDLDGPLLLKDDVPDAIEMRGGVLQPPVRALWG